MIAVTEHNTWSTKKKELLFHTCSNCQKTLKVSQIQIKRINKDLSFNVFVFYCRKCDLYYIIFKFDNSNKKRSDEKNG